MIWSKLHRQDSDFLVLIVGARGSGKSTAAVRLCELIDPDFTPEQVVFSPKQFSDLVSSKKIKRGSAILFDEIGVGANSREWYSMGNKLMNSFTQISRTMHLFCVFTTIDENKVDAQIKKNFTAICETDHIDWVRKIGWLKVSLVQVNPISGDVYHKYFRFWNNKKIERFSKMGLHLPSAWLVKAYKTKRISIANMIRTDMGTSYRTGRYTKFGKDFKPEKDKVVKVVIDYTTIGKQIAGLGSTYRTFQWGKPRGWNTVKIMDAFKLNKSQARMAAQAATAALE